MQHETFVQLIQLHHGEYIDAHFRTGCASAIKDVLSLRTHTTKHKSQLLASRKNSYAKRKGVREAIGRWPREHLTFEIGLFLKRETISTTLNFRQSFRYELHPFRRFRLFHDVLEGCLGVSHVSLSFGE